MHLQHTRSMAFNALGQHKAAGRATMLVQLYCISCWDNCCCCCIKGSNTAHMTDPCRYLPAQACHKTRRAGSQVALLHHMHYPICCCCVNAYMTKVPRPVLCNTPYTCRQQQKLPLLHYNLHLAYSRDQDPICREYLLKHRRWGACSSPHANHNHTNRTSMHARSETLGNTNCAFAQHQS